MDINRFISSNLNIDAELTPKLIGIIAIVLGGLVVYQLSYFFLKRWSRKHNNHFFVDLLKKNIYYPGFFLILAITSAIAWQLLHFILGPKLFTSIRHVLVLCVIGAIAGMLIGIITLVRELFVHRYQVRHPQDYSSRKIRTRFQLLQRVVNIVIIFLAVVICLMTFKEVRQVGGTLLASAGLMGIILGFAAQRSLGTLFAGIQIAISQPIRIEDTVVVQGQFGTISEITLTYVVVLTWDGKRLVIPINYFLEQPFENWTRGTPEIISKAKIYTDYTIPVDVLRKEFSQWVTNSPLWDKRSFGLVVTDATSSTIELRATMSAKNASDAFDLECFIREKFISYIQENYPSALPKTRVVIREQDIQKS